VYLCIPYGSHSKQRLYDIVIIHGVWIGNRIYWTLKQLVATLYRSLSHQDFAFRVTVFFALLGNGSQKCTFLYSRPHVLAGWRPSHTNLLLSYLPSQDIMLYSDQNKVKIMLRQTVSRSVLLSSPHLGFKTKFLLLSDSCGLVVCKAPSLMRGRVVCNCCWSSPARSFSGPSPAGLVTTLYCLRFETSPTCRARMVGGPLYITSARTTQRTPLPRALVLLHACLLRPITWRILSHRLATGVFIEPFPNNSCLWWFTVSQYIRRRNCVFV
jgi:hypothetical protein